MERLLFLIALGLASTVTVYPGAKSYIGAGVLNNLADSYIPALIHKIGTEKIPDLPLTVGLLLSKMHFNFTNIQIAEIILPPSSISVSLDPKTSMVTLMFKQLSLDISADFTLDWFGNYTGYTDLNLLIFNLEVPMTLSEKNSIPTFTFDKILGDYSQIDFTFSSNNRVLSLLKWLDYVWPLNKIDNYLIKHTLTNLFTRLNPYIAMFLKDFSYYGQLGTKDIALDYRFINIGVVSAQNIEADIRGDFLVPSKKFDTSPYTMNTSLNFMTTSAFRLQLTDYFFNTFLWALSDAGYLNVTVTSETAPLVAKYLTTTSLRLLFPGLVSTYGDNVPVVINLGAAQYPTVVITDNVVTALATGIANFYVIPLEKASTLAFSVHFNVTSAVGGYINNTETGTYLYYKINLANTMISNPIVAYTAIGSIDIQNIDSALNFLLQSLIGYINPAFGQFPIKLPIPKCMVLNNATIIAYNRAIEIAADPGFIFS